MASVRRVSRRPRSAFLALATVAVALAAAPKARAVNLYWQGGAYDDWSATNWGATIDGNYQDLAFAADVFFGFRGSRDTNGKINNDLGSKPLNTLNFTGQDWHLTGDALSFSGTGTISAGGGAHVTIDNFIDCVGTPLPTQLSYMNLFADSGASLTLKNDIWGTAAVYKGGLGTVTMAVPHTYLHGTNVAAGRLIDYYPSGNYNTNANLEFSGYTRTFTGTVNGGGSFTKSGDGVLTMTGDTSWTGDTTVAAGRLIMNTPWFSRSFLMTGGDLEFRTAETRTYANPINGYGSFTKSGTGWLTLSNAESSMYGGIFVNEGRLTETAPVNTSHVVASGASLEFKVSSERFFVADIKGGGSFVKSGAGTLYLTGLNTYTGGTTVSGGRLIDVNPHGAYFVAGSALEFSPAGAQTYSGLVSGNGSLTKSGEGVLTLAGANAYTGGTEVNEGRLIDLNPHGDYVTNADLEFRTTGSGRFGDPATNAFRTISGKGNFTKSGSGTLEFWGNGFYAGSTTVDEGGLVVVFNNTLPTSTALTINAKGTLYTSASNDQRVASLAGAGTLSLGQNARFAVDGAASTTFSGRILGNAQLTKSGAGTLTLSGVNAYSGGTTVNGGRLIDANPHGTYVTNADLEFRTAGAATYDAAITGSGRFTKSGAGTLTFTKQNAYLGDTTVNEGTLRAGVNYAIGGLTSLTVGAGGTFDLNGYEQGLQGLSGSGAIKLGVGGYLYVHNGAPGTFGGVISGAGIFGKTGYGDLILTGRNTYTGGTYVNDGRLIVTDPTGDYFVESSLEARTATDQTLAGAISRSGSFVKTGAGTLTLTGVNAYTGGTTVNEGRLIDLNPHGTYVTNAALEFAKAGDYAYGEAIAGKGSFTKSGAGTLTLSGANAYTRGTTVNAGRLIDLNPHGDYVANGGATLEFANATDSAFNGIVEGAGTFVKGGAGTLALSGSLKEGVKAQIAGGTLKVAGGTVYTDVVGAAGTTLQFESGTFSGTFSGAGALLKTGGRRITLTKAPTNAGGVRVAGGLLEVGGPGAFGGGLVVDAGATFANASRGTLTVNGASVNGGTTTTETGATTVFTGLVSGAGRFAGPGLVEFRGGYSPGASPAAVRFDGDLKLGSANVLAMELGGTTMGTGYDHLTVDGTAFLGGVLSVTSLNGFAAGEGQIFDLFDFKRSSGTFASLSLPTLAQGLYWNTSSLYANGAISVQAVPEPASLAAFAVGGVALLRRRRK